MTESHCWLKSSPIKQYDICLSLSSFKCSGVTMFSLWHVHLQKYPANKGWMCSLLAIMFLLMTWRPALTYFSRNYASVIMSWNMTTALPSKLQYKESQTEWHTGHMWGGPGWGVISRGGSNLLSASIIVFTNTELSQMSHNVSADGLATWRRQGPEDQYKYMALTNFSRNYASVMMSWNMTIALPSKLQYKESQTEWHMGHMWRGPVGEWFPGAVPSNSQPVSLFLQTLSTLEMPYILYEVLSR